MILFLISFLLTSAQADQIKVAVVDTGLDITDPRLSPHLCLTGHKDLTGKGLEDSDGHGTHVVGLIEKYADNSDYCLVIIKYTGGEMSQQDNYIRSLKEAVNQKPEIVNLSSTGENFSEDERQIICSHPEITFIVAAGNENRDIDISPIYPASLGCSNIVVVGARDYDKSNYGTLVRTFEQGLNVESTYPNNKKALLTGTSMSTAIHSGKLIYEKFHKSHSN